MPQIVVDPLRETHRIRERDPGVGGALRALLQADDGRVAVGRRHPPQTASAICGAPPRPAAEIVTNVTNSAATPAGRALQADCTFRFRAPQAGCGSASARVLPGAGPT